MKERPKKSLTRSESLRKSWAEGRSRKQPNPHLCACGCGELTIQPSAKWLKGHHWRVRKFSDEHREAIRKRAIGRVMPESHSKKTSEAVKATNAKPGYREKKRVWMRGAWEKGKIPERMYRDFEHHPSAKMWVFRDPKGDVHKFRNLEKWARANAWKFPDDHPDAISPMWKRVAIGLRSLLAKTKERTKTCYKGWTVVSNCVEESGRDLLDRTTCPPE